jgi:rRNA processing protein Gar1
MGRGSGRGREVGVVTAITPTGHITARAAGNWTPPEGTNVVDATGRFAGRIVRVFGPVSTPYISVRPRRPPRDAEAALLLGATLVEAEGTHGAE